MIAFAAGLAVGIYGTLVVRNLSTGWKDIFKGKTNG